MTAAASSITPSRTDPRITREAYLDYLTFQGMERPYFTECMGLLVGLEAEWRAQGATDAEIDLTAFGFDYVQRHYVAVGLHPVDLPETVVLEDTPEYRIERDGWGRTVKLCKAAATIPLPLDFPVKTMDDWIPLKKNFEYRPSRLGAGFAEQARAAMDAGRLSVMNIPGGFDLPRQLMGEENACLAFYDEPELIHDILATAGDLCERLLEETTRAVPVDWLSVHEDMAGKSGPLIGPSQIEEFLKPYYRRCWDVVAARGGRIFSQDSDGNMNAVIDAFLDCGVNMMHPLEPAAGMDIVQLRAKYGSRLGMLGGIDKHALRKGREAIDAELEYKLQPAMRGGGTVFCLDHRIPNGVPLEDYRYYVRRAREILGLDPNPLPGWERMSF